MAHQADGQYQARMFLQTLKSSAQGDNEEDLPVGHDIFFVIPWDTAHWMDLCMVDIRESSEFLRRFIKRANQFNTMYGRGKGHAEYQDVAKQNSLKAHVTKVYATTRFASSSFSQFDSIYESYEALCKAFSAIRETDDEDEEMKYMIKGRDFCLNLGGIIDILSKPMEMMIKSKSLDQYLWSVTKWWPKVKAILLAMKRDLTGQLSDIQKVTVRKELFPKLWKHYEDLNEEDSVGVQLLPGWMVVDTAEQVDSISKKKRKVIEWSERTVEDCLKDLVILSENVTDGMDSRYAKSVSEAAHILGRCLHLPDVVSFVQGLNGRFTARQVAARDVYGNAEFRSFYTYQAIYEYWKGPYSNCQSMYRLAKESLSALSNHAHRQFKDVVFQVSQVVWMDLGGCRKYWFPPERPEEGTHSQAPLKEYTVKSEDHEIDEKFVFTYDDGVYTARLDQATAFSTFYTNEAIYQAAGKEFCIALDVALAMSGSEAVVGSYYSVMNTQSKAEGQLNDTLTQRTNVDWCFLMPLQCVETIREVASLYLDGNKEIGLPRHQIPVFVDERGRALNKYALYRTDYFVLNEKDKDYKK
ncbi:Hypothetical predicted protein [Paramuricea clavata]|uniref:Uncharacterized protein n=1 Tax=Paramuricea clavata TaxID=317549 RepID=A0A6S7J555_PARCT|nr:Hypothetical predicted protein [Paramuricea clavata]